MIRLLKEAYEKAGLDLYMAPYGVLATDYERGIIEVRRPASTTPPSRNKVGDDTLEEVRTAQLLAAKTNFEVTTVPSGSTIWMKTGRWKAEAAT